MPGPRSKRKRTEIEVSGAAPSSSRRNNRDQTSGSPSTAFATENTTQATMADMENETPVHTSPSNETNEAEQSASKTEKSRDSSPQDPDKLESKSASEEDEEGNDQEDNLGQEQSNGPLHKEETLSNDATSDSINNKKLGRPQKMYAEKSSGGASAREGTNSDEDDPGGEDIPTSGDTKKPSNNNNSKASREERIRALISHRKVLLERLQQGRGAAQKRIIQLDLEDPSRKTETDEEERIRFANFAKEVAIQSRKQARSESVTEGAVAGGPDGKRTSLSLRKGSSVGKRMNAALSSLAPGSSAAAAAVASSATQTAAALANAGILDGTISDSATAVATASAASIKATSAPRGGMTLPTASAAGRAVTVGNKNAAPPLTALSQPMSVAASKKAISAPVTAASMRPGHARPGPKGLGNRPQQQIAAGVRPANMMGSPQISRPLFANITGLPLRRPGPPVVIVPEAVALRERKKTIETKLLRMAHNRSDRESSRSHPDSSSSAGSSALSGIGTNNNMPLTRRTRDFVIHGSAPRSRIPKRRRTHWDTVLEEMRWLATDFIEERKWKRTASQALASSIDGAMAEKVKAASEDVAIPEAGLTSPSVANSTVEKGDPKGNDQNDDDLGVSSRSLDSVRSRLSVKGEQPKARDVAKFSAQIVSEAFASSLHDATTMAIVEESNGETGSGSVNHNDDTTDDIFTSKVVGDAVAEHNSPNKDRKHEEYALISGKLEKLLKEMVSIKQNEPKPKSLGVDLLPGQSAAVGCSEEFWKREKAGSFLAGPESSGKTFATCAILWKNKSSGPQLVVCSPASMVKWFDELNYFDGLNVRSLFSESSESPLGAGSVLICNYGELKILKKEVLSQFRTIVVDSRYPVGYRGSRPKTCLDTFENASHSLLSLSAPQELASSEWWEDIISTTSDLSARRILLDQFDTSDLLGLFDGLSDRAKLEHISLRASFLFGKAIFPSSWRATKKNILGWARSHIKRSGNGTGVSKFVRVRELCCEMLDAATFYLSRSEDVFPSFDIVSCNMTPLQQSSYDTCCKNVKVALSRRLDTAKHESVLFPFRSFAHALMRLRRICTHANITGTLGILSTRTHLLGTSITSLKRDTPSQPDAELAVAILAGSGKLRELVRILVCEARFELSDEMSEMLTFVETTKNTPSKKVDDEERKKVAILAVLPEVQLLISILFGALGICHELLLSDPSSKSNPDVAASTWLASQQVLSSFNDKVSDSSDLVNIVIASPLTVAGNHGGLGVESADVVVVVDEDWSGRGGLLMRSLLSRVTFGKEDAECRFVRLVSKDSCEESFIVASPEKDRSELGENEAKLPWPVTSLGIMQPPKNLRPREEELVRKFWITAGVVDGLLSFPATGLIASSNKKLGQVLKSDDGNCFGIDHDALFLPSSSDSLQIETQVGIMDQLAKTEEGAFCFPMDQHRLSSILPPLSNNFVLHFPLENLGRIAVSAHLHRLRMSKTGADAVDPLPQSLVNQPISPARRIDDMMRIDDMSDFLESKGVDTGNQKDIAFGLLSYSDARKAFVSRGEMAQNAFASAYRVSTNLQFNDGSQGAELLVYFPPIFPRLLESSIIAAESVQSLRRGMKAPKRAPVPSSQEFAIKRLKTDSGEHVPISLTAEAAPIITEVEATRNDAASVLLDLTDDYGLAGIGAIPLPRDSALFAGQMTTENGGNMISADVCLDRDLPGDALPIDHADIDQTRDSKVAPQNTNSVILFVSRKRQRGAHLFQQSIRPGLINNAATPTWAMNPTVENPADQIGGNGVVYAVNGAQSGKKLKKKQQMHMGTADGSTSNHLGVMEQPQSVAGRAPQGSLQSNLQANRMKDIHRTRLIAAARQTGPGTTLFETAPFRAASVRLKYKMVLRLSHRCWQSGASFETGPGLPLIVSKSQGRAQGLRGQYNADPALWTSVVKRLKNSAATTGDEAIEVSVAQKSALRRSLAAPARVDFGPFNAGFLSSPSGMTAIAPPRPSLGVTLPMGVKLPQTAKDQSSPWTQEEEQKLKETTMKFGTNWTLSSRVLSGLQDVVVASGHPGRTRPVPRAAKTCREHWQNLARGDPGLAKEVRKVERTQRENSTLRFRDSVEPHVEFEVINDIALDNQAKSLLILTSMNETLDDTAMKEDEETGMNKAPSNGDKASAVDSARKRSFGAIIAARKRIQKAPNAIPGMSSSGQTTIAPSHPSHMQSVQSSVASSWTGGRTEMWPLQFLDAADRFRAGQAQQTAPGGPAPSRSPAVPASASRQHSNSATGMRSSSSGIPVVQHPHSHPQHSTNHPQQRAPSNSYAPTSAARGNSRVQSATAQSFAPPPSHQQPKPSSASRSNSETKPPTARK